MKERTGSTAQITPDIHVFRHPTRVSSPQWKRQAATTQVPTLTRAIVTVPTLVRVSDDCGPGAAATGVCASVYGQIQPASLKPNTNTPHIGCAGPMDQWPAGRLRRRRSQACMFGCMMGAMPTTRGSASRCN